jgi:lipopolysaccharide/colanic/teichoic acid biosynthesis glycosyltransferase
LASKVKRICDLLLGLTALIVSLPAILLIAVLVLAMDGRPVLFRQVRVGRGGVPFTMSKFRTMRTLYDEAGGLLHDDKRVTPLGAFLRRFRLDELPELWLVVTGRMSLVGPRPLPREVLEGLQGREERSTLRPGLTGLAQVSGNTQLTNQEKIALDLYYRRHWTFGLDIRIMFQTVVMLTFGGHRDEGLIRRALAECGAGPALEARS